MYVHRYGITFKEGIAMLEGPIAYLMFVKNKNQCPTPYMFPMAGVFRWFIYTNAKVYGIPYPKYMMRVTTGIRGT